MPVPTTAPTAARSTRSKTTLEHLACLALRAAGDAGVGGYGEPARPAVRRTSTTRTGGKPASAEEALEQGCILGLRREERRLDADRPDVDADPNRHSRGCSLGTVRGLRCGGHEARTHRTCPRAYPFGSIAGGREHTRLSAASHETRDPRDSIRLPSRRVSPPPAESGRACVFFSSSRLPLQSTSASHRSSRQSRSALSTSPRRSREVATRPPSSTCASSGAAFGGSWSVSGRMSSASRPCTSSMPMPLARLAAEVKAFDRTTAVVVGGHAIATYPAALAGCRRRRCHRPRRRRAVDASHLRCAARAASARERPAGCWSRDGPDGFTRTGRSHQSSCRWSR